MLAIFIVLVAVLALTTLRALKVKSFKSHLLIDGILFVLMLSLSIFRKFAVDTVICLAILLLWIVSGTFVRKYYQKFDFWFTNKMCALFNIPQYKSVADMNEDTAHSKSFSTALYYYAIEVGLCVLIAFL